MAMVLLTDRFKGNLIDMIGKAAIEALKGLTPPVKIVEGGGRERLEWEETAEDNETGKRFSIFPTARVYGGKVRDVGIRSGEFLFVVDFNEQGDPFFAAVPKNGEFGEEETNWIRKKDGSPFNWEVE